jgi:hypothetical protein
MKTEFITPRFTGARFDEHTLPVEVARDLAAYEDLVIELAKHLYLLEHPTRQRIPKGFEQSFSLHLENIEDGSARTVLAMVAAAGMAIGNAANYFEEARDLITECIQSKAAQTALPAKFPKELLEYFNVFGRSLRPGEALELPLPGGGDSAVLTPERRKALVLDAQKFYAKVVDLSGTIAAVDFEKGTFRLRADDGSSVVAPLPEAFREIARIAGGKERSLAQTKGVGIFDAWDRLQKIVETKHLDVVPNYELVTKIEELASLENGWMDGSGSAPDKEQLAWASGRISASFPEDVPFPHVCPTPEGGLFLEWIGQVWRVSAEILLPGHQCDLQAANVQTGETVNEEANLDQPQGIAALHNIVRKYIPAL